MRHIRLSDLLIAGRADSHPVAWRNGKVETFAAFRSDVAVAASRLGGCPSAAVLCRDSYAFAVGCFGALHAGARIVLPANGRPDTLAAVAGCYDRIVDDDIIAPGPAAALRPLDADRCVFDVFTSGSTGRPKRISKSLRLLENELWVLNQLWGDHLAAGPVLATVSHQHVYGLTFKVLLPLATGRPFHAETQDLWETVLPALSPSAILVTSPAHLSRLGGLPILAEPDRPSAILSAGAPLSFGAAQDCARVLGSLPYEIFGSTETGAIATRRQDTSAQPWRLLPGIEARTGNDGRLELRSPFVGPQWLETADMVEVTTEGFHFLGRADRVVKIEGQRVSLPEVEQALIALPWIDVAAAVLLPGTARQLAAAVVLNAQGKERLRALGAFRFGRQLRQALASSQNPEGRPKRWRFVDRLPLQCMDKRRDADIVALFEERE